jgi:hypothetical protein
MEGSHTRIAENLVFQALQSKRRVSAENSLAGQTWFITDLMSALWRIRLMLVLNHWLLSREYALIKALKALDSVVFMCNLYVMLSNITMRCFTLFTNGMFHPFDERSESGGLIRWEK